jgi:hypothetical protein
MADGSNANGSDPLGTTGISKPEKLLVADVKQVGEQQEQRSAGRDRQIDMPVVPSRANPLQRNESARAHGQKNDVPVVPSVVPSGSGWDVADGSDDPHWEAA